MGQLSRIRRSKKQPVPIHIIDQQTNRLCGRPGQPLDWTITKAQDTNEELLRWWCCRECFKALTKIHAHPGRA